MGVFPCPKCGGEAKAEVRTAHVLLQDKPYNIVYLRYRVKKHRRCKFKCDIGQTLYCTNKFNFDPEIHFNYEYNVNELLDYIMDDFQGKMEKGEIEWNKE